ncbi:hypothetical protein [Streptomyces sp. NPDC056492]|uniref:hypothetical protein n=1 Tax=unclassified Streptomyces TaxID=2593676 RepID=UPI0036A4ACB2
MVVCASNVDGRVVHWNFICRDGLWAHDDLDPVVAWDDLEEVTSELAEVLRAHLAESVAQASPWAMAGAWKDAQAPRSAPGLESGVEARLRV